MAKGRTVAVRITADTKGLVAAVTRAEMTLGNLGKTSVAAAAVLSKALAAGAIAAAGALTTLYVRQSQVIDVNAKLADRLGMSTEALYGLQFQADQSGVSSETLSKSLDKMNKTVGDAVTKGGAAADSFERMGLSAQELAKLPADQQLAKIADSISKMDSASKQAAAANDIFGRSGHEMLSMLRDGSAGIEEARRKAEAYGVTLSRVDAAKVEAANDAWDESQQVLTGIANRITVKLAPIVESVMKLFNEAALDTKGFGDVVDDTFNMAIKAVGFFADTMHGLHVVFKGAEIAAYGFKAAVLTVFEGVNNSATAHVRTLKAELNELSMQEMPSEKIERFVSTVEASAQKAAESVAQSRAAMFSGAGGDGETDDETKKKIEAFNQSLLTEEESEMASHQRRLAELKAYKQQGLDIGMSYGEAENRINQEHKDRMVEIERRALETVAGFRAASFSKQAATTASFLKNMTASVATSSKTMFNINKTAAIAEGLLNLKEAVMGAYKWGTNRGGPVLGAISAGIAGAAQIAQLNAIKNQQFGSGSAPSVGATPAPPVTPVSGGGGGGTGAPASEQTVFVQGIRPDSLYSGSQIVQLFNSGVKDGAPVKRFVFGS